MESKIKYVNDRKSVSEVFLVRKVVSEEGDSYKMREYKKKKDDLGKKLDVIITKCKNYPSCNKDEVCEICSSCEKHCRCV